MCDVPGTDIETVSNTANRLNFLLKEQPPTLDITSKDVLVQRLVESFEKQRDEMNATDYSRLAWLYLNLRDADSAGRMTKNGLLLEPTNEYCVNLAYKLSIDVLTID
jgi:hypothetical protein